MRLLKIIIAGLLIIGLLIFVGVCSALFYCAWERERAWGNASTLTAEFKIGTPSINFLDRAKRLGADELSTACGEWEISESNSSFDQINTKYKALLEGRASAVFKAGPFERDICNITIKQGKVIKAEARHLD